VTLLPYAVGGGLLLSLATGVGGGFAGRHLGKLECEAVHAKADAAEAREATKRLQAAQAQDDRAAAAETVRTNTVREITREVPKIIERPVYRNSCLDADGLRLVASGVVAANGSPAPTGGPADGAAEVRPAAER
jgi:hypothetical protein